MTDSVAVVALVVSLVALVVASLQALQQYFATSYDYRRCSARTMGGWSRHTVRRMLWKELRFEVFYCTPHIVISGFNPAQPQPDINQLARMNTRNPLPIPHYTVHRVEYNNSNEPSITRAVDQRKKPLPWFLDSRGSVPGARCSWLTLLGFTASVGVEFTIDMNPAYVDYMPLGITRPLATMRKNDFLALMTLFGIDWREPGKTEFPVGSNESHELTVQIIPFCGAVYNLSERRSRQKASTSGRTYSIREKGGVFALFNTFTLPWLDLTLETHNVEVVKAFVAQLKSKLPAEPFEHIFPHQHVSTDTVNGVYPGIGEFISCWAMATLPEIYFVNSGSHHIFSVLSRPAGYSKQSDYCLPNSHLLRYLREQGYVEQFEKMFLDIPDISDKASEIGQFRQWYRSYIDNGELHGFDQFLQLIESEPGNHRTKCAQYLSTVEAEMTGSTTRFRALAVLQVEGFRVMRALIANLGTGQDASHNNAKSGAIIAYIQYRIGKRISELHGAPDPGDTSMFRQMAVRSFVRGVLWTFLHTDWRGPNDAKKYPLPVCSLDRNWLKDDAVVYIG